MAARAAHDFASCIFVSFMPLKSKAKQKQGLTERFIRERGEIIENANVKLQKISNICGHYFAKCSTQIVPKILKIFNS